MTTKIHNDHATLSWILIDVQPNISIPASDYIDLEEWLDISTIAGSVQLWADLENEAADPNIDIRLETDAGYFTGTDAVTVIQNNGDANPGSGSTTPGILGQFYQYEEDLAESSTTNTSYQQKVRLSVTGLVAGEYRIAWSYGWRFQDTAFNFYAKVELDDTTLIMEHVEEPKDLFSDQKIRNGGFKVLTLAAGDHDLDLDWKSGFINKSAVISDAHLELWRVA